jgi:hypothetical protein
MHHMSADLCCHREAWPWGGALNISKFLAGRLPAAHTRITGERFHPSTNITRRASMPLSYLICPHQRHLKDLKTSKHTLQRRLRPPVSW